MKIISLLTIIFFGGYLYCGIYALYLNPKVIINRLYVIMSLCLAGFTLCSFLSVSSGSSIELMRFHKAGMFFIVVFFAMTLHYFILLTSQAPAKPLIIGLVYLPLPFLVFFNITSSLLYSEIIQTGGALSFVSSYGSFPYFFYIAFITIYNIFYLALVARWGKRSVLKKTKIQARVLFISLFIAFSSGMLEEILIPPVTPYTSHQLSIFFFMIPMAAALFTVSRTRFMALTSEYVSEEIVNNKLKVKSKIQLLDVCKEYTLLAQNPAEK
ncbi:MAG: hypothetical protein E4H36_13760 [Spirochaetales bacterium]|nr:MAG: hypothetical protein E4H36_13760 [Spirochaetales bacterium]